MTGYVGSEVGLTWSTERWRQSLASTLDGRRASEMTENEVDAVVEGSLTADTAVRPVVTLPVEADGTATDLGWLGESLDRLEAAGRVRRIASGGRRLVMRSSAPTQRQKEGPDAG